MSSPVNVSRPYFALTFLHRLPLALPRALVQVHVLAALLLCLALPLPHLIARDWHVSPAGNDAHDGTSPDRAFATLQKAASAANPGDTVLLGDGVYTDEAGLQNGALLHLTKRGRPDAWTTWKPAPGAHPELRPTRGWHGILITSGSYIILEGLRVTGANDSLTLAEATEDGLLREKDGRSYGGDPRFNTNGISIEGGKSPADRKPHHIIIRRCIISKMPGGGIPMIGADYLTVEDCVVFGNAWYMRYAGSGITTLNNWQHDDAPGYHIIIQRNLVWNNKTLVPWSRTGKLSDGNGILLDVTDEATTGGATNPDADAVITPPPSPSTTTSSPASSSASATAKPRPANPQRVTPVRPAWRARALIANNLSAYNGGSGIHVFRTRHVDIINNTTYHNGQVLGYEELFANRSQDVVFLNNIIVPRPDGGRVTGNHGNANIRWDYNLYSTDQSIYKGPNDVVGDPRFVSIALDLLKADFRLQPGSPARDSGTEELAQLSDISGAARPAGPARDRGAYEQ